MYTKYKEPEKQDKNFYVHKELSNRHLNGTLILNLKDIIIWLSYKKYTIEGSESVKMLENMLNKLQNTLSELDKTLDDFENNGYIELTKIIELWKLNQSTEKDFKKQYKEIEDRKNWDPTEDEDEDLEEAPEIR